MKTRVEIPDQLAEAAKQYAAQHGLSLDEVHERALRLLLFQSSGFQLKTIVTHGEGLQVPNDWTTIREIICPTPAE